MYRNDCRLQNATDRSVRISFPRHEKTAKVHPQYKVDKFCQNKAF